MQKFSKFKYWRVCISWPNIQFTHERGVTEVVPWQPDGQSSACIRRVSPKKIFLPIKPCFLFCYKRAEQIKTRSLNLTSTNCLPLLEQEAFALWLLLSSIA